MHFSKSLHAFFFCLFSQILHHAFIIYFLSTSVTANMSEVPRYVTIFATQFTSCVQKLNATDVLTDRYTYLLELQSAFDSLKNNPEGARPYDPAVVRFVYTSQVVLDFLYELEMKRYHVLVQHLGELRRRNSQYCPPQPPLPPGPHPQE